VITHATQQDSSNPSEVHIAGNRADLWLGGDEVQRLLQFLNERVGRLASILTPPATSLADLL
jgi:hypothetical protein